MARYRWDKDAGKMVEAPTRESFRGVTVISDLPEYVSPVTGRPVDGRSARREDLARAGCREVDPSERTTVARMINPDFEPNIKVMTNE